MKGIGIIIPNVDFSGSPLGTVTVAKTEEEYVEYILDTYCEKIGSTAHKSELRTLVTGLRNNGLYDGLDIYPMMGSTLTTKAVNLNAETGATGRDLFFKENASSVDDYVKFVQTISSTDTSENVWPNKTLNYQNLYIGMVFNRGLESSEIQNGSLMFESSHLSFNTIYVSSVGGCMNLQDIGNSERYYIRPSSGVYMSKDLFARYHINSQKALSMYGKFFTVTGNVVINPESGIYSGDNITYNGILGTRRSPTSASAESKSQYLFGGNVKLFVIGNIPEDKKEIADNLLQTFVSSVKTMV